MKKLLAAMFVALLMVGCGGPDLDDKETLDEIIAEAIDKSTLQKRGEEGEELNYAPNEQTPYTGWVKEMHDNGQINYLFQFKGGERDGLSISWYDNGQKWSEGNFKDGKRDGLGTRWYEDGQKKSEENFKDGKPWTAIAWKPNGEKCPVTKLIDGNGVWVFYKDDGTEWIRWTFKDGEEVRD